MENSMRLFRRDDGRYYAIYPPSRDLFGDLALITYHGNAGSHMGGVKTYYAGDNCEAILLTEKHLVMTRLAHGYKEVAP